MLKNRNNSNLKILLIQFKPAGDVLLLTPVVKALKIKYPTSWISFMVNEKESVLIKDFSLIDDLILIKKLSRNGLAGYFRYIVYNFTLIKKIRRINFDIVIDFIGNPKSAVITLFSKAPVRIGRKLGFKSIAYNKRIEKPDADTNTVIKRLAHLKPLGIDPAYVSPELTLNMQDKNFGRDYHKSLKLPSGRKLVILAPNSPRRSRRWKAEYFIATGKSLIKEYNCKILLAWGPGEEDYTRKILKGIGSDAEMIPLTTLTEMAAIISTCDLIITNDSSPKHIANALGIRSIAIYGPTNPYVWNDIDMKKNPALQAQQADIPCIQCEKRECPLKEHTCMEFITPDKVLKIVDLILNSR
ncbi:MAG: glycosyltransferase family 9 protein [Spirochaetes bacterium]|nr:glycosyltransferase family 9 protein [Spirochaetota bacterium]